MRRTLHLSWCSCRIHWLQLWVLTQAGTTCKRNHRRCDNLACAGTECTWFVPRLLHYPASKVRTSAHRHCTRSHLRPRNSHTNPPPQEQKGANRVRRFGTLNHLCCVYPHIVHTQSHRPAYSAHIRAGTTRRHLLYCAIRLGKARNRLLLRWVRCQLGKCHTHSLCPLHQRTECNWSRRHQGYSVPFPSRTRRKRFLGHCSDRDSTSRTECCLRWVACLPHNCDTELRLH